MTTPADTIAREHDGATGTATRTVCSYCGVGCGIVVTTEPGGEGHPAISRVAGDRAHPTNHGRLCTKGATHAELMRAPGRMTTAYVRPERGGPAIPASLDAAIREAARRLRAIVDEHGPDAVAVYVSGQMSTEAQYLSNKLVKGFLRGIHLESNSRLCMASAGTGYKQSLGADGPPGAYEDIDRADLFFVIGSNTADCHPILFLRMADRLRAGARLIVVDPRRTATADRADLFLQIRPGTDLALLNGLLHVLVAEGRIDEEFIREHTDGWDAMPAFLADYDPVTVARITGLREEDLRTVARWIGEAGEWMTLWTMGLNQSTHGTWNTNAICNLHLATGAICRPGSGPLSLTGQPNAMGGREMGYMGPGLPGQRSVFDADDRAFAERVWGVAPGSIRAEAGTGTVDMYRAMAEGEIKAAWIICTNPVVSVANRRTVIEGLEAADLIIAQDVFTETATTAYADILLPAALWVESDGVTVNSDRTLTLVQRSIDAPGDATPDWRLICLMAEALGFGEAFSYASSEEVFDELRRFWNPATGWDLRGVTYQRLREGPVQWPASPGDGEARHPIRYLNDGVSQSLHTGQDGRMPRLAFPTPSRRAQFLARPHLDPAELPDDDYPLVLNTGRLPHQWHTMTKTGRVPALMRLDPGPFVEVNPHDAEGLGIAEGDQIEVASRRGRVVLPAVVTDRVQPGFCFAPFHWNDEHGEYLTVNALTNDAVDEASRQPEFKYAAVTLRRVAGAAKNESPDAVALAAAEGDRPVIATHEEAYLAGFLAGVAGTTARRAVVPALPASAPVSEPVRAWFNGLLARAASGGVEPAGLTSALGSGPRRDDVLLVWGSQTGTTEEFARATATALAERGVTVRPVGMDAIAVGDLTRIERLLVVTSTFGDGGPPDNAAGLWDELRADGAPALDGLRYSVLAFGDTGYADFCAHGRSLDARLGELGATAIVPRVDCEAHDPGPARRWLDDVLAALSEDPRARAGTVSGAAAGASDSPATANATTSVPEPFTRARPLVTPLVRNELLSGAGSAKEVRRIAFDLSSADLTYSAGDSIGVVCDNDPRTVEAWLTTTRLGAATTVSVDGERRRFGDVLRTRLDVTRITPALLRFVVERTADARLARLVRNNSADLERFLWSKQAVDLLREFPVHAEPEEWIDVLSRLQPRQYSISSSPLVSPDRVEATVSVVRFRTEAGEARGGVCSTLLADRAAHTPVPIYLQRSLHFRPPLDPTARVVMVGPGTGVAPFRAFLHDRRANGHTGANWLFFGDQHAATDFLYRDELEAMHADGFLTRLDLAFSRDQRQKVYVQDRMLEHGARLWHWLQEGAYLYVCGDASRMARDVDATLVRLARVHGGLGEDDADEFKRRLVAEKRYLRDVY
ncbi:bifunctional nitrate reductase/sulfite reductase flavoprotein subunit alpha [Microbacterium immunditiarum]|uniref:assimilatory sulfite reductase (NADPH) n=1 Tax=Microbacterium immunditiarum TaxID=337480 RepID=A0A7Y9GPF0_9MICO|nr:bifunctional nitrate reductase/sulfite reductase flavoprotein subunit alpha [Microbacterium immunditiarum]NYE20129.1 NADPH-dependent sulfite reductase flavoprotein alpha-component [Microbacterium immunditiarum]